MPIVEKQQENYVLRSKIVVAEIEMMDGTKKYLTGVTNVVQSLVHDGSAERITVLESVPMEYQQRIGKPRIQNEDGETTGVWKEDILELRLNPGSSYTHLYSGDVSKSLSPTNYVIIEAYSEDVVGEVASNSITGQVVEAIETTGLSAQGILIGVIIGLVVLGLFYNPVYNLGDYRLGKHIQGVTEHIHDMMDDVEQGQHRRVIEKYPDIKQRYNKLPLKHKTELSFAMEYLGEQVQIGTVQQWLQYLSHSIPRVRDAQSLAKYGPITQWLYKEYAKLPLQTQDELRDQINYYNQVLWAKNRQFGAWPRRK